MKRTPMTMNGVLLFLNVGKEKIINSYYYLNSRDNLNDSDIEGGEEGVGKVEDDVKITPFNMREELEEGHFDKDGHYHWNKETEIKDNWLDNIDWVKVK